MKTQDKLYNLISLDKLDILIEELFDILNEYRRINEKQVQDSFLNLIQLSGRFSQLRKNRINGTFSHELLNSERAQIREGVIKLVFHLPKEMLNYFDALTFMEINNREILHVKDETLTQEEIVDKSKASYKEIKDKIKKWKKDESRFDYITLLILDFDDFTVINKIYGEHIGDLILNFVPKEIIIPQLEKYNSISGWIGNDEYYVLLLNSTFNDIKFVANSVSKEIKNYPWNRIAHELRLTCSVGISQLSESEEELSFVIRTLIAIKEAKKNGKNRIEEAPLALPSKMVSKDILDYLS